MTTERDNEALNGATPHQAPTPPAPTQAPSAAHRRFGAGALVGVALVSAAVAAGGALLITRASDRTAEMAAHDHAGTGAGARAFPASETRAAAAKGTWQCPMHPTVVQDHPGDCPICGMKLVKAQPPASSSRAETDDADARASATAAGPQAPGGRRIKFYRSPMDPKQTSPTPRKDEMGMDYLPVYGDEASQGAATSTSSVPGLSTVEIDPARQQLIGLQTAEVTEGEVGGAWRTVGRVGVDETRVRHVNVKVPGYVERIYADFIGKPVRKGEPLFSVYSPELLAAQQEYLLALRTRQALTSGSGARLAPDGDSLVQSARRRLELWDIPATEIDRLARRGEPTKTLTLYSPVSGVVAKKDVVEGMKLDAGAMPYEIVDLSSVWVLADVYESELRHVKEGMPATMTLKAFPGEEFRGRVQFIDPMLDPATRTVKVRLSFANPGRALKPEMFGDVVLHGTPRRGLRIPQDAVVNSGTASIVFVALGDGKFQPRAVTLGDASDWAAVEVVEGLRAGEQVVTRANFLIDSESRLRASLAELAAKNNDAAASGAQPESARVIPGGAEPAPAPHAEPQGSQDSQVVHGQARGGSGVSTRTRGTETHGGHQP